ncbi:hypothetical protein D9M72_638630 [compost metagenome]
MEHGGGFRLCRCLTAEARARSHRHLLHLPALQSLGSLLRQGVDRLRGDGCQGACHAQHLLEETSVEHTGLARLNG